VLSAGSEEDDPENDHEESDDDGRDAWLDQHEWGDNAVMTWEAGSNRDDDVSSIDPREAGILDDVEDDWGRDALLAWDEDDDDIDDDDGDPIVADYGQTLVIGDDLDEGITDGENIDETTEALVARGMPMYRDWQVKDLQVCIGPYASKIVLICRDCAAGTDIDRLRSMTPLSISRRSAGEQ
jgi:hypothetical protein